MRAAENPSSQTPPDEVVEQIYENPDFLPLIDVEKAKITLQDLATSLQQLQVDYSQMSARKEYLEDRFSTMMHVIETTIAATTANQKKITETLTTISLLEHNLQILRDELKNLKKDLALSRAWVEEYVLFLYQSYQQLYGTTDSLSWIKQLVDMRQVDLSLNAQHFAEMLTESLQDQLVLIQRKQQTYVLKVKEMNTSRLSYYKLAKSLQKDLTRLEEQKKYLYAQLRTLQTDKVVLEQQLSALQNTQEIVETKSNKLTSLTLESSSSTSSAVSALLELPDRPVGRNYFTRPVLPPTFIPVFFGEVVSGGISSGSHLSEYIRIDLPQGSWVTAVAPGLVYRVFPGKDGESSRIMIIHKKGLLSFYKSLEDILVKEGDVVYRGQAIATVGGTPGTRGAGWGSDGAHIDFAVYINGMVEDPFEYLDLSVLDKAMLPEYRQQKYLDDLYMREVPIEEKKILPGKTIEERRDAFLQRYAWGPYADAALRYDAAEGQGIDPLMGICVGFAETGFKNFKSSNNIGNVGNNDRGDVVVYESPVAGARALYGVLNNRYLGQYYTLNELSRFGNSDGFIYASSPYNRQRNIMKCLSSIYGYPIPEDFPFRRPR